MAGSAASPCGSWERVVVGRAGPGIGPAKEIGVKRAISRDGTAVAFGQMGEGPAVILVDGTMAYRDFMGHRPLASPRHLP